MRTVIKVLIPFLFQVFIHSACQPGEEQVRSEDVRIISLAPHITEIIYALGAQDQLLAVTDFCNYPPAAQEKEKIGGLLNANIERMIALQPTLIFGLPSHEKLNQQLQPFGFQVIMMPNEDIREVLQTILEIGRRTGRQEKAENLVKHLHQSLDSLRSNVQGQTGVSAVLIIGRTKGTLQNITVAGDQTFIDELWQLTGGLNIYKDLPTRYGSVNLESLLLRNPAVIIELEMQMAHAVQKVALGEEWQLLREVQAVKNGQVYVIGGSHTMIPGPRLTLLAKDFNFIIRQAGGLKRKTSLWAENYPLKG